MSSLIQLAVVVLTAVGIWFIIEGVRTLANKSPDIEHDSAVDKRLFSPYTRYFLARYYAGGQLFAAGFFCFAAAFIIYIFSQAQHRRHCSIDEVWARARTSYVRCLLRNLRKFLCLRRGQVKHNAVILQIKPGRRKSDFMLADAQEAAEIGA